jgi:NADH:ubiquinone oxidoreductase subunit E
MGDERPVLPRRGSPPPAGVAPEAGRSAVVELARRPGGDPTLALARLDAVRGRDGAIGAAGVDRVAAEVGLPAAHVAGAASFFSDLSCARRERHVRVCDGTACFAAVGGAHLEACGRALGAGASIQRVNCLGYCYDGPAALDGERGRPADEQHEDPAHRRAGSDGKPEQESTGHPRPVAGRPSHRQGGLRMGVGILGGVQTPTTRRSLAAGRG